MGLFRPTEVAEYLQSKQNPVALEHLVTLDVEGRLPDELTDAQIRRIKRACSELGMRSPFRRPLLKSLQRAVADAVTVGLERRDEHGAPPDVLRLVDRYEDYDALCVSPQGPRASWELQEQNAVRAVLRQIAHSARTAPEAVFPVLKQAAAAALEARRRAEIERQEWEAARKKEAALARDRELLRAAGVRSGSDAIRLLHARGELDSETADAVGRLWEKAQREVDRNPLVNLVAAIELVARELHEGG